MPFEEANRWPQTETRKMNQHNAKSDVKKGGLRLDWSGHIVSFTEINYAFLNRGAFTYLIPVYFLVYSHVRNKITHTRLSGQKN